MRMYSAILAMLIKIRVYGIIYICTIRLISIYISSFFHEYNNYL